MPQLSVMPANISPAPMNAGIPAKYTFPVTIVATALTRTMQPAAIRTYRCKDMTFLPRMTGKPAATHASVPPSTFTTLSKPVSWNFC